MKKLIFLSAILFMNFQCDNDNFYPLENEGVCVVKNTSGQNLIIKYHTTVHSIANGGTVWLSSKNYPIVDIPDFELPMELWENWADANISFQVLSGNGTPLVKWNYTDKDAGGRQFFDAASWVRTEANGNRKDELKVIWTFEIKAEDIAQ